MTIDKDYFKCLFHLLLFEKKNVYILQKDSEKKLSPEMYFFLGLKIIFNFYIKENSLRKDG